MTWVIIVSSLVSITASIWSMVMSIQTVRNLNELEEDLESDAAGETDEESIEKPYEATT